jgi:hypothetical protein
LRQKLNVIVFTRTQVKPRPAFNLSVMIAAHLKSIAQRNALARPRRRGERAENRRRNEKPYPQSEMHLIILLFR